MNPSSQHSRDIVNIIPNDQAKTGSYMYLFRQQS